MAKLALAAIEEAESPRDILRNAIKTKKSADTKAEQARFAIGRARRMASEAEAEARRYSEIEKELGAHFAEQIAASVLTGSDPDLEPSPGD